MKSISSIKMPPICNSPLECQSIKVKMWISCLQFKIGPSVYWLFFKIHKCFFLKGFVILFMITELLYHPLCMFVHPGLFYAPLLVDDAILVKFLFVLGLVTITSFTLLPFWISLAWQQLTKTCHVNNRLKIYKLQKKG